MCDFILVLFEKKLEDVVIMEGEAATLSCTISDSTSLVTWRRNYIPLQNCEKYELRKEGKVNLLLIHDVEPLDTGIYSCDTGDTQSSAKLTVTGKSGSCVVCRGWIDNYIVYSLPVTFHLPLNDNNYNALFEYYIDFLMLL